MEFGLGIFSQRLFKILIYGLMDVDFLRMKQLTWICGFLEPKIEKFEKSRDIILTF